MGRPRGVLLGAVVTGFVLMQATTSGAVTAQEVPNPPNSAVPRVASTPNPPIADQCGIDVTLVLDASGSIKNSNAVDDVREAAGQFLGALADTDSRARVTQFAALTQELAPSTLITAESVAPGGVHGQATTDYYNPIPQRPSNVRLYRYDGKGDPFSASNWDERNGDTQYTNWQGSLKDAGTTPDELVVYITDGEPTAYDFDRTGDPFGVDDPPDVGTVTNRGDADQVMLDRSVEAANSIKESGTRILAIGVGNATSSSKLQDRLEAIAGPQLVDDLADVDSINEVDVAIVEDFGDLAQFLRSVVLELCSPSLTITKLAQTAGSASYTPAPGWSMTVEPTVSSPATGFDWVLPDTAPAVTKTVVTNANGTASFQWEPTPVAGDSTAVITESFAGQDGSVPGRADAADWRCELRDEFGNVREAEGELVQSGPDTWSFTLDPIGQEIVACTVWNSFDYEPGIALTKVNSPTSVRGDLTPAARVTSTYEVTNTGNTPLRGVDVADDECNPSPQLRLGEINVGDTNEDGLLDPFATSGEVWVFQCDRPIRGQSSDPEGATVVNNAVVVGFDPTGQVVTDDAADDVVAWNPLISLTKHVNGEDFVQVEPGDPLTYTYEVTNTGNTPLDQITLTDVPPCAPLVLDPTTDIGDDGILSPDPDGPLEPLTPETWTYSCTTSATDTVVNTATVTGRPLDPLAANAPFPDPNPLVSDTDQAAVDVVNADIVLTKSVSPELVVLGRDPDTGELVPADVVYTYTVTNPGAEYLARPGADTGGPTGLEDGWIDDTTCGPVGYVSGDDGDGLLAPGGAETWTFQCAASVTALTVNIATIEAQPTDADGVPFVDVGTVTDSDFAIVQVLVPEIIIEKIRLEDVVLDEDSQPVFGPDAPDVRPAGYLYDVGNIGTVPLRIPAGQPVDDTCDPLVYEGGDNNGNDLLDPFEVWTYRCERLLDRQADSTPPPTGDASGLVRNVVTVDGIPVLQDQEYPDETVSSTDDATVQVIEPGIDIVKFPSDRVVLPGTVVTFTYEVSNTGDVGLDLGGPVDDRCFPVVYQSGDTNGNGLLDGANGGAEEWIYTCSRRVFDTDGDGIAVNNVVVGGFDPLGNLFTATDSAQVRVISPAIDLEKTVDRTLVPVGTEVTYTFEVTNVGSSPLPADDALANVITADAAQPNQPGCLTPVFTGGDDNGNDLLDRDPAEVWTYTCSAVITEFTTNIAIATGLGGTDIDPNNPVRVFDRDSQAVDVFVPAIAVEKTAEPTLLLGSGEVTYTYEVTNEGDVPLADVAARITDDTCAPVTYVSGDDDLDGLLDSPNSIFEDAADETWIFQCTTTVDQTTTNTVEVAGRPSDPDGVPLCGLEAGPGRITLPCDVTDDDTALVEVIRPGTIIVEKTAYPPDSTQEFQFALTGQDDFSLSGGGTKTFTPLAPGDYTLTEQALTGWGTYDLTCADPSGNTAVNVRSGSARITLEEGETVTCTYTNVKFSGIVIRKVTSPASATGTFDFDFDGSYDFQLGSGEEYVVSDFRPGEYSVAEQVPDGWQLTGLVCDDPSGDTTIDFDASTANIVLGLNEIVTCTFTNTPRPPTTTSTTTTTTSPPTTVSPILPPTGSSGTFPTLLIATVALIAGAAALLAVRVRRRPM